MNKHLSKLIKGNYYFLLCLFLTMYLVPGKSQTQVPCGTDELYKIRLSQHPELAVIQKQMEAQIDNIINARAKTMKDSGQIIVIPVVFHIIHQGGPENISLKTVTDQIDRLNIDYRKQNKDTSNIRRMYRHLATDARIQFKLATMNPWGQCTNGIDRINSAQTINATDAVKSLSWWDSKNYLNIWVVRNIAPPGGLPPGVILAGYSHFPWDAVASPSLDGVVVGYPFVGKSQRTLTHEIGHSLGLYHPFQDGCSSDQNTEGDHVADTPPVAQASYGWDTTANTCHQDKPDLPDQIENYMDYADNKYMFTPDQVWRMRAFAMSRAELISAANIAFTTQACTVAGIEIPSVENNQVSVYPNPATNIITIEIANAGGKRISLAVSDITGKILFSDSQMTFENGKLSKQKEELHIQNPGIYFIKMNLGNTLIEKKVIVQN